METRQINPDEWAVMVDGTDAWDRVFLSDDGGEYWTFDSYLELLTVKPQRFPTLGEAARHVEQRERQYRESHQSDW